MNSFSHRPYTSGPRSHFSDCFLALFLILTAVGGAFAQGQKADVRYDSTTRVFRIDTSRSSYIMGINEAGEVQNLYWGHRLPDSDEFAAAKSMPGAASFDPPTTTTPEEYEGWGGMLYVEPSLKVTFPDGNRDLVLKYVSYKIDGDQLNILMKDISREVYVTLYYRPDGETGILRRWAEIENRTDGPITIEAVSAATWNLPRGNDYRLRYLTGRWAGEWTVQQQPIHPGKTVLESRRGTTGAQNNPWFAIDHESENDSERGSAWFGALGWSGSWQISIEQDMLQQVRINGGPNSFDFAYRLPKGGRFQTPDFYGGYSDEGIGGGLRGSFTVTRLAASFQERRSQSCVLSFTTPGRPQVSM